MIVVERRAGPPWDEVPGSVGGRVLLLHDERGAAWVDGLRVWPSGCAFRLGLAWHSRQTSNGPLCPIFSRVHPGFEERFVEVSVETADGRVLRTNPDWTTTTTTTDDDLVEHTGIGTDCWADAVYWVSPLPEPPTMHVSLAWPAAGLAGRAPVPTDGFAAAAHDSFPVW